MSGFRIPERSAFGRILEWAHDDKEDYEGMKLMTRVAQLSPVLGCSWIQTMG